jgi:hypothetical protein
MKLKEPSAVWYVHVKCNDDHSNSLGLTDDSSWTDVSLSSSSSSQVGVDDDLDVVASRLHNNDDQKVLNSSHCVSFFLLNTVYALNIPVSCLAI